MDPAFRLMLIQRQEELRATPDMFRAALYTLEAYLRENPNSQCGPLRRHTSTAYEEDYKSGNEEVKNAAWAVYNNFIGSDIRSGQY